ncbi:hypothetical protein [Bacteroides pyogenes]|uniref:hypothetical protein n=1 Tax=Bacteroides pyogenes TaxID=310300 RepID=UPI001BA5CD32|nr:hypothetical protein [Bacteroides pyogenes]
MARKVLTEEEYLSIKGYGMQGIGDVAMHKGKQRTLRQQNRITDKYLNDIRSYSSKREQLRQEYRALVNKGKITPPSNIERLFRTSRGNSDNESVRAARRVLEKHGYDWRSKGLTNG